MEPSRCSSPSQQRIYQLCEMTGQESGMRVGLAIFIKNSPVMTAYVSVVWYSGLRVLKLRGRPNSMRAALLNACRMAGKSVYAVCLIAMRDIWPIGRSDFHRAGPSCWDTVRWGTRRSRHYQYTLSAHGFSQSSRKGSRRWS